jgi:hypothetical protein
LTHPARSRESAFAGAIVRFAAALDVNQADEIAAISRRGRSDT